jgi:hypothetical protein
MAGSQVCGMGGLLGGRVRVSGPGLAQHMCTSVHLARHKARTPCMLLMHSLRVLAGHSTCSRSSRLLPSRLRPQVFVGQYLFTGSETSSVYLTVQEVRPVSGWMPGWTSG